MKILLLVAGSRGGSEFFQSLLDGHSQILMAPGYILMYFYPHWDKHLVKEKNWKVILNKFLKLHPSILDTSKMKGGDFLLIGNGLDNRDSEDILKAYSNKYLDKMLVKTLTEIGLKEDNLEYGARFNNSRIEMYYTIKKDCKIKFLEKEVQFNRSDQIVVAVSYKYTKEDFMSFLNIYFDDVITKVSEDGSYALALCKK